MDDPRLTNMRVQNDAVDCCQVGQQTFYFRFAGFERLRQFQVRRAFAVLHNALYQLVMQQGE